MKRESAKKIIRYYYSIAGMKKSLRDEKEELEDRYGTLGCASSDGMPHASAPGSSTEIKGIKNAELGTAKRIRKIEKSLGELEEDQDVLEGVLDGMNFCYKKLLSARYQCNNSWVQIATKMHAPESTVRSWHDRALDVFGSEVAKAGDPNKILGRAYRARV